MHNYFDKLIKIIVPLIFLAFISIATGIFILRKHKVWYNYIAFSGEILFIMWGLWRFQQYRFYTVIAIISSVFLVSALAGNAILLQQKKIQFGSIMGVRLGVYTIMLATISVFGMERKTNLPAVNADTVKPTEKVFNMHISAPITDNKTTSARPQSDSAQIR